MRIAYHQVGLQGVDLAAYCADIAGLTLVPVNTPEDLEARAGDCEALMLNSPLYTKALATRLMAGSPVRWLQFASAGFDTAVRYGVPDGVVVTNGSSVWGPSVAEHAVALVLALLRAIPHAERERARARWDRAGTIPLLGSLEGARVGIIGYGAIGSGIAARIRPFGAKVVGVARTERVLPHSDEFCLVRDIDALLPTLDIVILSLPLSPETHEMANTSWFSRMKNSALLINVGRGGLVNEPALVEALRARRLAGAGLDVAASEPLAADSPLWALENVLITPHVASSGGGGNRRLLEVCRENILHFMAGERLRDQVSV